MPNNIAIIKALINEEPQYLWGPADSLKDDTPLCPLSPTLSFSSKKFRDFVSHASSRPISFLGFIKADKSILNPISNPGKTICTALNYSSHIRELSQSIPKTPTFFSKYPGALTNPYSALFLPNKEILLDNEVELALIVGDHIPWRAKPTAQKVEESIFGYVLVNDVTSRRLLIDDEGKLWRSKNLPKSTPVGPWIIPTNTMKILTDFIEPGTPKLNLRSSISRCGVAQSGSTNEMLFSVTDIFNKILEATSLEPGDLIFTGTPGGTGLRISRIERIVGGITNYRLKNIFLKNQERSPRYLQHGDAVTIEGEWLGIQQYPIEEGTP